MNRIEVNVQSGEIKSVPLTQNEIDDANARYAAEQASPKQVDRLQAVIDELAASPTASQKIKDLATKAKEIK